jgi:cbb3-type cytochrome oxidase subunit 3
MIKNVLTHIGGVENFGIISISLFFTFFTGMLIWAFRQKRTHLDAMSTLPLERDHETESTSSTSSASHHE